MITVEPRRLLESEIEGISDPHERIFAQTALRLGFELYDGGMISLPRGIETKLKKRSTNPDFFIVSPDRKVKLYVEITRGENLGSRKAGQKAVMDQAGYSNNYYQLTGSDITEIADSQTLSAFLQLVQRRS